jgi:hypothetical protein
MIVRIEHQSGLRSLSSEPASRALFALMLVVAGIGAAVAPFVADLLTAGVGVVLALAVWTALREGAGPATTTKILGAV